MEFLCILCRDIFNFNAYVKAGKKAGKTRRLRQGLLYRWTEQSADFF